MTAQQAAEKLVALDALGIVCTVEVDWRYEIEGSRSIVPPLHAEYGLVVQSGVLTPEVRAALPDEYTVAIHDGQVTVR